MSLSVALLTFAALFALFGWMARLRPPAGSCDACGSPCHRKESSHE